MSQVRFDPAKASLQAPRGTLNHLVALAEGSAVGPDRSASLRAAGVIDDDGIHPAIAPALSAISTPVCTMTLTRWPSENPGSSLRVEGWTNPHIAVLLLPGSDDICLLTWAHPTFLPVALARLVGLGPRPGRAGRQGGTPQPWPRQVSREPATTFRFGDWGEDAGPGRWEITMRWDPAPPSTGTATLRVLDSDDGYRAMETPGGESGGARTEGRTIRLLTSTEVWREILALLPDIDDLAPSDR
jgi:hypothetical protein